jgi:hypothetical protein
MRQSFSSLRASFEFDWTLKAEIKLFKKGWKYIILKIEDIFKSFSNQFWNIIFIILFND